MAKNFSGNGDFDQNNGKEGVVYILENDAFKDHWFKIGQSTRSGHKRAQDLNREAKTGVPGRYKCIFEVRTQDCGKAEKEVFKRLHKFRKGKMNGSGRREIKQEFFSLNASELEMAKQIIIDVCEMFNDTEKDKGGFKDKSSFNASGEYIDVYDPKPRIPVSMSGYSRNENDYNYKGNPVSDHDVYDLKQKDQKIGGLGIWATDSKSSNIESGKENKKITWKLLKVGLVFLVVFCARFVGIAGGKLPYGHQIDPVSVSDVVKNPNNDPIHFGRVIAPKELNVRSGPGIEFATVKKVYANDIVSVYKTENGWSYIGDGWINSKFVKDADKQGK